MGSGKRQVSHFMPLIERIAEHVNSWHSKLLSYAGCVVLIKHVLSSIPIHVLSARSIPEECIYKIEMILANFFWGKTEFGKRRHWCRWELICRPVEEGGLSIRNLRDVRKAFILKKCWGWCIQTRFGGALCVRNTIFPHPQSFGEVLFGAHRIGERW